MIHKCGIEIQMCCEEYVRYGQQDRQLEKLGLLLTNSGVF